MASSWRSLRGYFSHPCPFSLPTLAMMLLLVCIVPFYILIGELVAPFETSHRPEIALDRMVPVSPAWAAVYLSLYAFVILPFLLIRNDGLMRRWVMAYFVAWGVSYAFFLAYPTAAPRPPDPVAGDFFSWLLGVIYSCDPAYNCFPSLHVAQCYISAMLCYRICRASGRLAVLWATLIAVSTLFTKQHYVLDVVAGTLLAGLAFALCLRGYRWGSIAEADRRFAPGVLRGLVLLHAAVLAIFWLVYAFSPVPAGAPPVGQGL